LFNEASAVSFEAEFVIETHHYVYGVKVMDKSSVHEYLFIDNKESLTAKVKVQVN